MIDLSKRKQDFYKIKLENGTVLKLKKPTQAMLMDMVDLHENGGDGFEVVDEIYNLLTRIFNRNANEIEFTKSQIEEMLDLTLAMEVIEDYLNTTLTQVGK